MKTKTEMAVTAINAAIAAGKNHKEARAAGEQASGLVIYSEGPAGSAGEGDAYVSSLPRGSRGALFDIHANKPGFPGKLGKMLMRHYAR